MSCYAFMFRSQVSAVNVFLFQINLVEYEYSTPFLLAAQQELTYTEWPIYKINPGQDLDYHAETRLSSIL